MERGSSEGLCWGGGELLRAWLLRACLRAAVGRGLVWVRSCAAVSPGEVFYLDKYDLRSNFGFGPTQIFFPWENKKDAHLKMKHDGAL